MTDKENEGNLEDQGGAGANPNLSGQTSQPLDPNLAKVISELQATVKSQAGEINALKSGKDSAIDRIERSQKDTFARIATVLGVDEEKVREAQRNLVLDDLVAERLGNAQSAHPADGTVRQATPVPEFKEIDDLLDLPENDPRVTNLKLLYGHDRSAYIKNAKVLKESLKQSAPTPAEQLGSAPASSVKPSGSAIQAKIERLNQLQRQPSKNREEIRKLTKELDAVNWNG